MSTPKTADTDRRLIDLRHAGASWDDCARQLLMSKAALQLRARRLRDADKWRLADGKRAKGELPRKRGRPRSVVPRVAVSPRFAPEVADALRTVADSAGVLLGQVVTEALERAQVRANGKRPSATPLGLEPGKSVALRDGVRTETVSVNVPKPVYEAVIHADAPPMTQIAEHVTRLLTDLNFRLIAIE